MQIQLWYLQTNNMKKLVLAAFSFLAFTNAFAQIDHTEDDQSLTKKRKSLFILGME